MKKITILVTILICFTGTSASAQTKNILKSARNFRNLERSVLQQTTVNNALRSIPTLHMPPLAAKLTTAQIHTLLKENQTRIADLRKSRVYEEVWDIMEAPKAYVDQNLLGQDLADFYHEVTVPQFRTVNGKIGKVYELPVEGLGYAPFGKPAKPLDPETQIVFHIEGVGSQILDRSLLENPLYFQLVIEGDK